MDDWFTALSAQTSLSASQVRDLRKDGFIIVPGPIPASEMPNFAAAYDEAVSSAAAADVAIGGSTTRVSDFVNRSQIFDAVYLHEPLLEASSLVIEQRFKLSTMLARTLRPQTAAQELHVDFASDAQGWPMVGFIFMIDEFRRENGDLFYTGFARRSKRTDRRPCASLWSRRFSDHLQRLRLAWPWGERDTPAQAIASGILHSQNRKLGRQSASTNACRDINPRYAIGEISACADLNLVMNRDNRSPLRGALA
jgi:hypothetical protein